MTDWQAIKDAGILSVIHKASQGHTYIDPTYHERRTAAKQHNLLWGAYHFGESGNPTGQADHFLRVVQPEPTDLLVLDWEEYIDTTMRLAEAEIFVNHVAEATGRVPGLYSGQAFLTEQVQRRQRSVLQGCWLWLARYSSEHPVVPPLWPTWSMWQYTDSGTVPGVDGPCDRNRFNGDEAGLYRLWGFAEEEGRV